MKRFILSTMMLGISLFANAQATDLVVDCQTPGWLSSKINYGDQQTVKNLKVTGYINSDDLKFIGSLVQDHSLNEILDLSDVNIIENCLYGEYWGITNTTKLRTLHLPHTVKEAINVLSPDGPNAVLLNVDTLYFNCDQKHFSCRTLGGGQFIKNFPKTIIVSDKTDSIPDFAFYDGKGGIESVILPNTTRYIGNLAFSITGCKVNSKDLQNLEYWGIEAFAFSPDTIIVPEKIQTYNLFSSGHGDGQHIFIGQNVKNVNGGKLQGGAKVVPSSTSAKIIFHFSSATPPNLYNYRGLNSTYDLSSSTIYVPKGAKEAYMKADYWGNATIIELNPVESISMNKQSITLKKDEQFKLSVTFNPTDADDKTIVWSSSNESIATVDANGNVTAIKAGEVWVKAVSKDNAEAKDSCKVTVTQPVTGITLNEKTYTLSGIGESVELVATVQPDDATNKAVKWKSTNEAVCMVVQGKVVAVGYGVAVIMATTEDGGFMDYCTVTVEDNTAVRGVKDDAKDDEPAYDASGRKVKDAKKGQIVIKRGKKYVTQ